MSAQAATEQDNRPFLVWVGLETDLIFNQGVNLPHFSSFPLLDDPTGRERLAASWRTLAKVAASAGCRAIIDSPTWTANRDRAAPLEYGVKDLERINREAVTFMREVMGDELVTISANFGPRGDGYEAGQDGVAAARDYHAQQIGWLDNAGADILSGYTIGTVSEGIGMLQAAATAKTPVMLALTVETDGRLPDGTKLAAAITEIDSQTDGKASHFLINCAHPDHIAPALDGGEWARRVAGVVANASRQSHDELDNATELDDGDPAELGALLTRIRDDHPWMNIFGGCCGTDMRHIEQIGRRLTA